MISKLISPTIGYAFAAALLIGFAGGYKLSNMKHDAALAKALTKADKKLEKARNDVQELSGKYEEERNQTRVVETQLSDKVRIVYRSLPPPDNSCSAPDSVVRLLKDGIDYANASTTNKSSQ